MEVEKLNVDIMKTHMARCFNQAMNTGKGFYSDIKTAREALEKGKGIYQTLDTLDLLSNKERLIAIADIEYIEDKMASIQRERMVEIFERHLPRRREIEI